MWSKGALRRAILWRNFGAILARFWRDFGAIWDPKEDLRFARTQTLCACYLYLKTVFPFITVPTQEEEEMKFFP
jgi:hypothetical protein